MGNTRNTVPVENRMRAYRQRMRAEGLRPVQLWVPDTRSQAFVETCREQAKSIAGDDPDEVGLQSFVDEVSDWPEP